MDITVTKGARGARATVEEEGMKVFVDSITGQPVIYLGAVLSGELRVKILPRDLQGVPEAALIQLAICDDSLLLMPTAAIGRHCIPRSTLVQMVRKASED
jgi:hypothetical protein